MGYLGEHVHYYPDGVVASRGLWKCHDEVHTDVVPLPLRNLQRLQQSRGLLMFGLDSVAYVAAGNIIGNILWHPVPPKYGLHILIHLGASRVNGVCRLVCFSQYLLPQVVLVWYTDPVFEPQYILLVCAEMFRLSLTELPLDSADLFILGLSLL